jgi:hypothetical protein
MKTNKFLFILLLFLLACNKDELEIFFPGAQEHGFFTASKKVDGRSGEWSASGFALIDIYYPDLLNFRGDTEDEYGQRRESLSIRQIPMKLGKYNIQEGSPHDSGSPESRYYRLISDGDVTGANYGVRGKKGNWVEIIEIDTVAKVVKGKFNVHYIISDKHKDSGFPEKVDFEDGYFEVEIIR